MKVASLNVNKCVARGRIREIVTKMRSEGTRSMKEKEQIAANNNALFIFLAKNVRIKRGRILEALKLRLVELELSCLQQIRTSADSYLIAIFKTTKTRDKAKDVVRTQLRCFPSDKVNYHIQSYDFGDRIHNPVVWTISAGAASPEEISKAIVDRFPDECLNFQVKNWYLTPKVKDDNYSTWFDKPVPWEGNQIEIGGSTKLITHEKPDRSSICRRHGHNCRDCTSKARILKLIEFRSEDLEAESSDDEDSTDLDNDDEEDENE